MLKKFLYFVLIALVIIQFFHPEKNNESTAAALSTDVSKVFPVPDNVQNILQNSCYDCHSNNTQYPWYAEIQPVAWWLDHHIEEGKKEVNFNEFATYSLRRQYKKFEEIIEQVKKDEMPPGSYTLIHRDAILNKDQKLALSLWASAAMDSMKAKYPADSLKRK
jgi:Haem-binding domain